MSNNEKDQETRARFYGSKSLAKYIKAYGAPRSRDAWRAMVASSSSEDLDSEKGIEFIACLKQVTFFTHPQQVNIMDRGSGKIIVSIPR
jgi:hypothetical protein